ncbi:hypothetical protein CHS0354_036504 [Potamilus streckersoni]|uniref:Carbonic anhydrase n=1 Tax=Potamilus streckersoni TaxID=2493646 RepID=A0AAE0VSF1_9BIVA|nr:hypothetical protein CHS0354_036504 [Potamilus streckersoni]
MPTFMRVKMEPTLLFVLIILRFSMAEDVFHWGYRGAVGPKFWPENVPTCGGRSQSPVDIHACRYNSSLEDFIFSGYNATGTNMYQVKNNGHTIQVDITKNNITISGGGLASLYTAAQFHFHWGWNNSQGSEHTLNGKMYPMELHIVHYKTSLGSIGTAAVSGQADALAVLGFFFEVTSSDNAELVPILSQLDHVRYANNSKLVSLSSTFSLKSILPDLQGFQTYYRYSGSLTTPTCLEVVIWTVFESTIGISEQQLAMLRGVFETENGETPEELLYDNYRPVQALGTRKITTNTFHWSYEEELNTGPSNWLHHYETCRGNRQSPIDIPKEENVQYAEDLGFIKFFGYEEMRVHKLKNNGHSLQVDIRGNFYISGGGLAARYQAAQFHFHWAKTSNRGSEHTFDGTAFPMELHIVHFKEEYGSIAEALNHPDGLAVLGFMFKVSSADSDSYGSLLQKSSDIEYYGESTNTSLIQLMQFLPIKQENLTFFRYNGSLTTPPCTEAVIWTVFTEPVSISEKQLQEFRKLHHIEKPSIPVTYGTIDNNYRPIQRLNGRQVLKNFKFSLKDFKFSAASRTVSTGTMLSVVLGICFLMTRNH